MSAATRVSPLRDRVARLAAGAWLGLAATLLRPQIAQACSVCMGGEINNRAEFIITTAILTFLPLIIIGSVVWWLRRRVAALAQQEEQLRAGAERAPVAL